MSFETPKIEGLLIENQQKILESPRIIVRLLKDGDDDQVNSMNQLLEYMACFSSKESFKYQIGLLLEKERATIYWREISLQDHSKEIDNSARFSLYFPYHNILIFVKAIEEEKVSKSKNVESELKGRKFENLFGLYDLFIFCKCISHILCMKNS